jgi:hypothetical protein
MSDSPQEKTKGEIVGKAVAVAVGVFFFAIGLFLIMVMLLAKFATKTH